MNTVSVIGNASLAGGISLSGSSLTVANLVRIHRFGYFSNAPIYGNASTLEYDNVNDYNVGNEWTGGATTAGYGIPQNVKLSGSTVNLASGTRGLAGNLMIASKSATPSTFNVSKVLYIGGNLTIDSGNTLQTASGTIAEGDIYLAGNWSNAGTFNPTNKAVFFNGPGVQTITNTNAANANTETFAFLINNKPSGRVLLASHVNVSASTEQPLQLLNTGTIDLGTYTLALTGNGGNIQVLGGARTITGAPGSVLKVNGAKTVISSYGGSLTIDAGVTAQLFAPINFGASLTTIGGILEIHPGGAVNTYAPLYATGSKLLYKTGGTYGRYTEWSATSGAGYPYDVQVSGGTILNYPNTGAGSFSMPLAVANDLTIDSGSSLYMSYGDNGNKSGFLTVGRHITNQGNFSLGNAAGGDVSLGGNWNNAGSFYPNNRTVTFVGNNNNQSVNGATTFDYLTVNKSGSGEVYLGSNIVISKNLNLVSRSVVLGAFNMILPNKTSVISSNNSSYLVATGAGKLIRQNLDNTADWIFPMGVEPTGRYAPIMFKSLSGITDLSINVGTVLSPAVDVPQEMLKTEWFATTTNSITATVNASWQGAAEQGSAMVVPDSGQMGVAVGANPYALYEVTLAASNTERTGVSLSSADVNGIVIGNTDAISDKVIWYSSQNWSNGTGPTARLRAFIQGPYVAGDPGRPSFAAKALTIESGGSVVIKPNYFLSIVNGLINTQSESAFVVQDGGNLLQTENGAINTGNIEVQKAFTFSGDRKQYNYVSSPTVGTNVKSIYTGTLDNSLEALYHNENTNYFGTSAGTYIAGRALALKEPSTGAAGGSATNPSKFRGVPFNGILNYPLAYTTNRPNVNHGYNLVGNPYPSNLDLVALYNYLDNQNRIESTILFWDNRGNTKTAQEGSGYNGNSYAKFNVLNQTGIGTDPTLASGALPSRTPTRYVSPGQGFMVRAKSDANGKTLQFSNGTMRVTTAATQFFGRGTTAGEMDRYWLSFTAPTDISVSTAVVYFEGGSTTFGQDDSEASNSSDNLYTIADAHNISIHGRPVFTSDDIVPLGYSSFKAGNATISILDAEGTFHNGQSIYLKDKILNTITDLTQGDYTFETQKGTFTNRFEILYKPQTILATDQTKSSSVMVYRDATDFVVQSSDKKIDWVEVYDMSGRLYKTIKAGDKIVRFSAQNIASGTYILKIVREGELSSKRILK